LDGNDGPALNASRLTVARDMFCDEKFQVKGQVSLEHRPDPYRTPGFGTFDDQLVARFRLHCVFLCSASPTGCRGRAGRSARPGSAPRCGSRRLRSG
jgi:hypothetical protein